MVTYMHTYWLLELPCLRCTQITCVIVYVPNNEAKHTTTQANCIKSL